MAEVKSRKKSEDLVPRSQIKHVLKKSGAGKAVSVSVQRGFYDSFDGTEGSFDSAIIEVQDMTERGELVVEKDERGYAKRKQVWVPVRALPALIEQLKEAKKAYEKSQGAIQEPLPFSEPQ